MSPAYHFSAQSEQQRTIRAHNYMLFAQVLTFKEGWVRGRGRGWEGSEINILKHSVSTNQKDVV